MNRKKLLALILTFSLTSTISVHAATFNNVEYSSEIGASKLATTDISENEEKDNFPTVEVQTLYFNKASPKNLIIENINFNNHDLKKFSISQNNITNNIICNSNSIEIPADIILDLNLSTGYNITSLEFSDGSLYVGFVYIYVTDSNDITPDIPGTPEESKPQPDEPENSEEVKNPTIENQVLDFDLSNPKDLTIKNVNFDETNLSFITINNKNINANDVIVTDNTITIPAEALSGLNLVVGNYNVSAKFSNGTSSLTNVYIKVTDSNQTPNTPGDSEDAGNTEDSSKPNNPGDSGDIGDAGNTGDSNKPNNPDNNGTVNPPVDDTIDFDMNNSKFIEIPNFIPNGTKVNSITINNKVMQVIYSDAPIAKANPQESEPVVYVSGNSIIIPAETLKYINVDESNSTLNIDASLDNGKTVSGLVKLNITAFDNNTDNNDNNNNTTDTTTNNTTDNNNNNNNSGTVPPTNTSTGYDSEITNGNNSYSTLPNTGGSSIMSTLGLLATVSGIILSRKRNNK